MYIKKYFRIGSLLNGNQRGSRFLLRGDETLFHCDRLGQIPWLIDIFAFANSNMIGEEL